MLAEDRLRSLRTKLQGLSLDAYIVPTSDDHASEYPSDADRRRQFISNFTGSAGTAVVGQNQAWLWTDGRYFLQAESEINSTLWTLMRQGTPNVPTIEEFISSKLHEFTTASAEKTDVRVGFDPYLTSTSWVESIQKKLNETKVKLVAIHAGTDIANSDTWDPKTMVGVSKGQRNLVDEVWDEDHSRPPYPSVGVLPFNNTGATVDDKIKRIKTAIEEKGCDSILISSLSEVAWLLNLRGLDADFSRIFLSYALITPDGVSLYLKNRSYRQSLDKLEKYAGEQSFLVKDYELSYTEVEAAVAKTTKKFWMPSDANSAMVTLAKSQGAGKVHVETSPLAMMKAKKNDIEIRGFQQAHRADGAALALFFSWLHSMPKEELALQTEFSISAKLREIRLKMPGCVALSFETIAGVDDNGAVIHYRPLEKGAKFLNPNGFLLVDSGGHYVGGTTDVTRTVHFGMPNPFEKEMYTRVLQGHIDLALLKFPEKYTGTSMDVVARRSLFNVGLDYLHGTGHGVGHSLEVHEIPPSISSRSDLPMEEGMVVSNEPGVYLPGEFGIRIENLQYIKQSHLHHRFNNAKFLQFEQLTMFPYCNKLIAWDMLTDEQLTYINDYHAQVLEVVSVELERVRLIYGDHDVDTALSWLDEATTRP